MPSPAFWKKVRQSLGLITLIVCWPLFGSFLFVQQCRDAARKRRAARKAAIRPPLPLYSSSHGPAISTTPSHGQTTLDQAGSLLFRLPVEIRNIIYAEVLRDPSRFCHIYCTTKGFAHAHCLADHTKPIVSHATCWGNREDRLWAGSRVLQFWGQPVVSTKILQTCRRINIEATPVLYEENVLSFRSIYWISAFFDFVPAQRLQNIRSLHINQGLVTGGRQWPYSPVGYEYRLSKYKSKSWEEMCRSFSQMQSLQVLCVAWSPATYPYELPATPIKEYLDFTMNVLHPLSTIKRSDTFEVYVDARCLQIGELEKAKSYSGKEDVPFTLHIMEGLEYGYHYMEV